ncbi:hypothetical protein [Anianabacter salinae]|uniref:hypothetical protein n=1 Tax=Anianabacter salinae TaxID=2851023 RepID=UPI00225E62FB|nr:hypothetical protein [Anianabacter salinae]
MRAALVLSVVLLPHIALADDCRDRIAALYDGGAMDDAARPPHLLELLQYAPDGSLSERSTGPVIDGTHYQLWSETAKMGVLYIGTEVWYRIGAEDAPWGSRQEMPEVRAEDLARQLAEKAGSITEAECLGQMTAEDGGVFEVYRWRVFTETMEDYGGGVNGAIHEAWVDPGSGLLRRRQDTEVVTPWQAEPDGSWTVASYTYDPSITLTPPAE